MTPEVLIERLIIQFALSLLFVAGFSYWLGYMTGKNGR